MKKIDFKKEYGELYFPSAKEAVIVDVPPMNFVTVSGTGNPNDNPAFQQSFEALYGVSYTLRFGLKKQSVAEYRVGPLEALWWTDEAGGFSIESKEDWKWTVMVMQPDVVTRTHFDNAVAQVREKRNPVALPKVRFERFDEGLSAQVMHLGPYATEKPTIERLHHYIKEHEYKLHGKHHEIYLGDPRRSAPEKLKTVLRQPMRR